MSELRQEIIKADEEGNLLQTIYKFWIEKQENRDNLIEELIRINNEGQINIIIVFLTLSRKTENIDFFLTRNIFEKALPRLNAPIRSIIECVLHLVSQAGNDLMAKHTFISFADFYGADPERPQQVLSLIQDLPKQQTDFISVALIVGARIDMPFYFNEAIKFTKHESIEIRIGAIFALGKIFYEDNFIYTEKALTHFKQTVIQEFNDELLGALISSCFSLYLSNNLLLGEIQQVIEQALSKGQDCTLYAVLELFAHPQFPESLLNTVIACLLKINPKNEDTLYNIDNGLARLIEFNHVKAIDFLESLLLTYPEKISIHLFPTTTDKITGNNKAILNKLITRWFLKGESKLCNTIYNIINNMREENACLEVDFSVLAEWEPRHFIFLARKSIGYLFFKPITAASIIISLMHRANEEVIQILRNLLFDPLLLNSSKVHEYLMQQVETEEGEIKKAIEDALNKLNIYLEGLESIGEIPALQPSQAQKEAYQRYQTSLMAEAYKREESKSIFSSLATKISLLYGRKVINYINGLDGQPKRMEIPLHTIQSEVEYPRLAYIDPVGLDYMLRIFKQERFVHEAYY